VNLGSVVLTRCRSASASNMTSTGQWSQLTTAKNSDGSDASTFTPQTPTFACNIQELDGESQAQLLPLAPLDLAYFRLFVPWTIAMQAKDRVIVDSITYEIQDTDVNRSTPQISRAYLISRGRP
jgi:hypothetical protein